MKSMKNKVKNVFMDNAWLSVVAIIVLFFLGVVGWKFSLHLVRVSQIENSIYSLAAIESGISNTEQMPETNNKLDPDKLYIRLKDDDAFLYDAQGKQIFGPCKGIFLNRDYYYDKESVFRYIDMNGLIGYGKVEDTDITILSQGIYSQGSEMLDGSACVKEGKEIFYIDKNGKRFTFEHYKNAYPFAESQGSHARVQKMDGSWSVINRQEEEVVSGFDYIDQLPYCSYICTGVRNGEVVIFTLEQSEAEGPHIITSIKDCIEVNSHFGVDYIGVTSKDGKQGVVNIWNGEIIVPVDYEDIQWGYSNIGGRRLTEVVWFQCQKTDNTFDMYYDKNIFKKDTDVYFE